MIAGAEAIIMDEWDFSSKADNQVGVTMKQMNSSGVMAI